MQVKIDQCFPIFINSLEACVSIHPNNQTELVEILNLLFQTNFLRFFRQCKEDPDIHLRKQEKRTLPHLESDK